MWLITCGAIIVLLPNCSAEGLRLLKIVCAISSKFNTAHITCLKRFSDLLVCAACDSGIHHCFFDHQKDAKVV